MSEIRVRMAPSPTGFLHIGGLRTALYNFLLARQQDGKFILRIEDTDRARLVEGATENIIETLHDFSLDPDEGPYLKNGKVVEKGDKGPYFQSERLALYRKYAQELVAKGFAYPCFCSTERLEELRKSQEASKLPPKYDKHCLALKKDEAAELIKTGTSHVIRLNVPKDQAIRFTDLVHGEISISTNDLDDQVLIKSDGFPTYHLAVVVDDHLMEITHVIRGDEWIPSTPKHILLYSALGWESPKFVHLPLLLSKTHKKLSKREGDVAVKDFLARGYLPEALLNFVALLGWNPGTEQEVFSLEELVKAFSLKQINKAGAVFDLEKLEWINGLYIRRMDIEELLEKTIPFLKNSNLPVDDVPRSFLKKIIKLEQERLKKLSEIGDRVGYFFKSPEYDPSLLVWKKTDAKKIKQNLANLLDFLKLIPFEDFEASKLEVLVKKFIADSALTNGEVLWPLRVSLSGLDASPGPFDIMDAFGALPNGKELVESRLKKAIDSL
ncbi:MAG: glutamate--tRNA ligase [Acidobacteriaceae bacterium]